MRLVALSVEEVGKHDLITKNSNSYRGLGKSAQMWIKLAIIGVTLISTDVYRIYMYTKYR